MELKIFSPEDSGFLTEIKWNNEELKAEVAEKMKEYETLVYSEDNLRQAKSDRAHLNKFRSALEDERKRIKKRCMEPYELFERQVKEVVALVERPISLIDKQLQEYEDARRIEKKGAIMDFYNQNIGTLRGILPFERVLRPEYLNATKTMKSIQEEMLELMKRVDNDLNTIESLESEYELQIKDVYCQTYDLSRALQEKARLEEVERRLEERKAAEAVEKNQRKMEDSKQENASVEGEKHSEAFSTSTSESQNENVQNLITIEFRVAGTKEQLDGLKQYLRSSGITFGPVER